MIRAFDTPIKSNDQSIDRVLAAGLPVVLVVLNGSPAQDLEHMLKQTAAENAGKALIVQVQAKDNPATREKYQIRQTPAVVTVKNGEVLTRAENITPAILLEHVAFLLGKGTRPAAEAPRQPARAASASGRQTSAAERSPLKVTDATFDREVLGSSKPVLVDFWAPWCGPCRMTDPILEKLAHEVGDRLRIAKVNVDENPRLMSRYGIQSIPTMMVVKSGQIVDRWMGALPEPMLRNRISPHIPR